MKLIIKFLKKPKIIILQFLSLVLIFLSQGFSVLIPKLSGELVDYYLQNNQISQEIKNQMIIFIFLSFVFTFLQLMITSYIAEKIGFDIRNKLIDKILKQTYQFINKTTPSKLLTNLTSDIINIKNFISNGLNLLITSIFMIIGSFILMLSLNTTLSLIILPILPTLIIIFGFIFKRVSKLFKKSQKIRDHINNAIDENIKASMLVRVLVSEATEIKKFSQKNLSAKIIAEKIVVIFSWLLPIINLANYTAIMLILSYGGMKIINNELQTGELLAFYQYVTMFIGPIIVLGFIANTLSQMKISTDRINNVLNSKIHFKNGDMKFTNFDKLSIKNGNLIINKKNILKNINFEIIKSQKIGIVGITGSGKSMLLQIIPRFIDLNQGKIILNNKNIKNFEINSWRSKIGFVFQNNFLFSGTIKDNIVFGQKYNPEKLKKIAKITLVDEIINKFDSGFDQRVGERGSTLSGGQKQRITMARALYHNPQFLILDDSTSKLDIETEQKIFQNLNKYFPDLTMIIVAQKIVSIKSCDQIYVMENGQIIDKGTHNELKSNSFLYQEILLSQKDKNT